MWPRFMNCCISDLFPKKTNYKQINIHGQQWPHIQQFCATPAANSTESQPGAGYGGPGFWGPGKSTIHN